MPEDNNSSGEFILDKKTEPDKLATEKPIQEKPRNKTRQKITPLFFFILLHAPRGIIFNTTRR